MKESVKLLFIMNSEDEINLIVNEISKLGIYVEHCMISTLKMLDEMLSMKTWDLIILERGALEADYIEVLQYLQNLKAGVPVIAVTKDLQEEDMFSAIKAGCSDYLSKFDYINIKKVVYRILQNNKAEEIDCEFLNISHGVYDRDKHFAGYVGLYQDITEGIVAEEKWSGEFANRKKDDSLYWVSTSISSVKDSKGVITNYVSSQEDITEKKKLQDRLEKSNKQLLKLVDKLKSTQKQLIQQEKLAGIGQLAAGVAHEINNPLGYVISNFDTLKKYVKRFEGMLEHYKQLEESIKIKDNNIQLSIRSIKKYEKDNKMDFILSDLNDLFTDTEDGLMRVKKIVKELSVFSSEASKDRFTEYDVNCSIENTLQILNSEIEYNANVVKKLGQLPLISARGDELNKVWLNIISNAVYAIKCKNLDRFGTIKIATFYDEQFIFVIIEDNGIGIQEEHLNKIFNPFFTTKPIGEGTGLGLSISYDIIVNKHCGEIMVESKQGIGTKFIIKIPKKPKLHISII